MAPRQLGVAELLGQLLGHEALAARRVLRGLVEQPEQREEDRHLQAGSAGTRRTGWCPSPCRAPSSPAASRSRSWPYFFCSSLTLGWISCMLRLDLICLTNSGISAARIDQGQADDRQHPGDAAVRVQNDVAEQPVPAEQDRGDGVVQRRHDEAADVAEEVDTDQAPCVVGGECRRATCGGAPGRSRRPPTGGSEPAGARPASCRAGCRAPHGLEGVRRAGRVVAADLAVERADQQRGRRAAARSAAHAASVPRPSSAVTRSRQRSRSAPSSVVRRGRGRRQRPDHEHAAERGSAVEPLPARGGAAGA